MAGKLVVVATPIGNLNDLSPRARAAFEEADLVACEDTGHTGRLLAHLVDQEAAGLPPRAQRAPAPPPSPGRSRRGEDDRCGERRGHAAPLRPGLRPGEGSLGPGIRVEPIPGPSVILAALVASGLPPYPFTFAGFPPPKSGKRRTFYKTWAPLSHTIVFFESPHRLLASLEDASPRWATAPPRSAAS